MELLFYLQNFLKNRAKLFRAAFYIRKNFLKILGTMNVRGRIFWKACVKFSKKLLWRLIFSKKFCKKSRQYFQNLVA